MDLGLLHEHLRIVREGERLLLTTKERVDLGFPTEQREFGTGFVAVRSYKDVVEVPDALRRSLPTSFDVIGDIAVLKIPEALQRYREQIGLSILRWNPKIRVAVQDRGVKGERRVRSIEVIAGERRTRTVHTEYGLHYRVDLAQAYFSPRLASERKRIADLVLEGEVVADPFAGVGPFAILIAKRRRPPLARDDLDRSNSSLALHPSILHGDPDLRIPPENRESNLLAVTLQLFGDFQDGNISDHIKGGGKGSAQSVRHLDDVFVASNGNKSRTEFPLFRWETKVDSLFCREEQPFSLPDDA